MPSIVMKPKVYAVAHGHSPGIYTTWAECKAQTHAFSGAVFKSFPSVPEAQAYLDKYRQSHHPMNRFVPALKSEKFPGSTKRIRIIDDIEDECPPPQKKLELTEDSADFVPVETVHAQLAGSDQPLDTYPSGAVFLYTDGASQRGRGGAGYVIKDGSMAVVYKQHMFIGDNTTSNEAEYSALILGLRECIARGLGSIVARLDSKLVVEQTNKCFAVKKAKLKELAETVEGLVGQFEYFRIEHVYRRFNTEADKLSKEALTKPQCTTDVPLV